MARTLREADNPELLRPREFELLSAFIERYCGIKMPPSKKTMLEGRLRRRVRATGMAHLRAYCEHLFEHGGLDREAAYLIDAVTTNKTDFFREPEHFRTLVDTALPDLLARRRAANRPIKLWSVASSTGAEAYTMAMVMADFEQKTPGLRSTILATDISTEVLQTAVQGIYPEEMATPIPAEMRRRYILRSKDRARAQVRVAPDLRGRVRFARLNLMDDQYPVDRDIDVAFCRNVLIYFEKDVQRNVLQRVCDHLVPGGYLFLGHSESLNGFDLPLRAAGNTTFQRI